MTTPLQAMLDKTIEILRPLLPVGTKVALLDFPRHQNAGDSLIWLGQISYLKQLGVEISYVASMHYISPSGLRRRVPNGPILLSGGGNLGDRWSDTQSFREFVIQEFTDRQIIQLPQTIEFNTEEALVRAQSVFSSHPRLHIMIRDLAGAESARVLFPSSHVLFCPDLALGVGPMKRIGTARYDVVSLLRRDSESLDGGAAAPTGISHLTTDWEAESVISTVRWRLLRFAEDVVRVIPHLGRPFYGILQLSFRTMAKLNVRLAAETLSKGRVVTSDRLHGMILAALLGIPVVANNNANGKVWAVFQDYVSSLPGVHFAKSRQDSIDFAATLASHERASTVIGGEIPPPE